MCVRSIDLWVVMSMCVRSIDLWVVMSMCVRSIDFSAVSTVFLFHFITYSVIVHFYLQYLHILKYRCTIINFMHIMLSLN